MFQDDFVKLIKRDRKRLRKVEVEEQIEGKRKETEKERVDFKCLLSSYSGGWSCPLHLFLRLAAPCWYVTEMHPSPRTHQSRAGPTDYGKAKHTE